MLPLTRIKVVNAFLHAYMELLFPMYYCILRARQTFNWYPAQHQGKKTTINSLSVKFSSNSVPKCRNIRNVLGFLASVTGLKRCQHTNKHKKILNASLNRKI